MDAVGAHFVRWPSRVLGQTLQPRRSHTPQCENGLAIAASSRRSELHRNAVNAIAHMCGRWTIIEDVAKVTPPASAVPLGANHPVAPVLGSFDRTLPRMVEARPASPT